MIPLGHGTLSGRYWHWNATSTRVVTPLNRPRHAPPVPLRDSEPQTLVDRLKYWLGKRPNDIAYHYLVDGEDDEILISYQELDRRARAIAGALLARGLGGERALLLFGPGLDFVVTLLGCFYAGVVAVPAFPPRRNRNMTRLEIIAHDARAKAILTTHEVTERTRLLLQEGPMLLRDLQWLATDQIEDRLADDWAMPQVHSQSLAFLQYTSGSTGSPKGVMLTHANIIHNCHMITGAFAIDETSVGMSWLPTYHDMGLIGGVLNPLYCGCRTILMSPMAFLQKPFRWLRAISKYRATTSGGPNFAYDICTKKIAAEEMAQLDLSSWELAFNGAEPVRSSTIEMFSEKFAACGFRRTAFYPCYGMAESTLIVTGGSKLEPPVLRDFDAKALETRQVLPMPSGSRGARTLVGCGRRLPSEEVLIVDPDRRVPLPEDRIGEIWVSSGSVGLGYLNRQKHTRETFQARLSGRENRGMFLRTGDLGFFENGELFIAGRLKDLIIVRGVNRYPQDIEMTVEQADDRLRPGAAAAFAVEMSGQEKLIVVSEVERVSRDNWSDVIARIRRSVVEAHELNLDGVVLVRAGSIPKTSSGKIQRHACRQGFIDGSLLVVATDIAASPCVPGDTTLGHHELSAS